MVALVRQFQARDPAAAPAAAASAPLPPQVAAAAPRRAAHGVTFCVKPHLHANLEVHHEATRELLATERYFPPVLVFGARAGEPVRAPAAAAAADPRLRLRQVRIDGDSRMPTDDSTITRIEVPLGEAEASALAELVRNVRKAAAGGSLRYNIVQEDLGVPTMNCGGFAHLAIQTIRDAKAPTIEQLTHADVGARVVGWPHPSDVAPAAQALRKEMELRLARQSRL